MSITDPIADLLTALRNANIVEKEKTEVSCSALKIKILDILKSEGFIKDYKIIGEKHQRTIRIYLRFNRRNRGAITNLRRISKSGIRVYAKKGFASMFGRKTGIAIISTSRGVMTDREAKKQGIGGEILCHVW